MCRAITAVEREGAYTTHFLSEERSPRRAWHVTCRSDLARACSPANARLECDPAWGHGHVLGEGQRTPPLLHYAVHGACVGVHMRTYVRVCMRASNSPAALVSAPDIDAIRVIAGERRGDADRRASHTSLLRCATARHLAVRADSLLRDGETTATRRNACAHIRPETRRGEMRLGSCPASKEAICHVLPTSALLSLCIFRAHKIKSITPRGEKFSGRVIYSIRDEFYLA